MGLDFKKHNILSVYGANVTSQVKNLLLFDEKYCLPIKKYIECFNFTKKVKLTSG